MSKAAVGDEMFKAADHLSQETVGHRHRHRARRHARAERLRDRREGSSRSSAPSHDYPITPKEHGVDFLLDRRHLWIRTRAAAGDPARAARDHQRRARFLQHARLHPRRHADLHAGGVRRHDDAVPGAVLRRQTAYLTQSGQLYNEANAMALGRVYCFGPTFRAEKSKTRRHLTEFWMVEPEVAYADLDDVMDLAEGLVVVVVGRVLDKRAARAEGARARHRPGSKRCRRRFRASPTTRRSRIAAGEGTADSNGAATSAAPTRRRSPSSSIGRSWCTATRRRSRRST